MAAINTMVKKCAGLIDTKDISDWENRFLKSIDEKSKNGENTTVLSTAQVEKLEEIHGRHFSS
jgi:hypothetical protein